MSLLFNRTRIFPTLCLILGSIAFCSCQSDTSRPISKDPYAANAPETKEEEAYYQDVYSGDWREQTGPFGMGKSIGRKNGSTTMPTHWAMMPHGAMTTRDLLASQQASETSAPTQVAYNPYPQTSPGDNATAAPNSASIPNASYATPYATGYNANSYDASRNAVPDYQPTGGYMPGTAPAPYSPTPVATPTTATQSTPQSSPMSAGQPSGSAASIATYGQPLANQSVYASEGPASINPSAQQAPLSVNQSAYQPAATMPAAVTPATAAPTATAPATNPVIQESSDPAFPTSGSGGNWMFQPAATGAAVDHRSSSVLRGQTISGQMVIRGQMPEADSSSAPAAEEGRATSGQEPERRLGGEVLPLVVDPALAAPWKETTRGIHDRDCLGNEYISDGGDAHREAYVTPDWQIHNLEQEDTIAHFDTLDGKILVEPSNRVCIYSPRFGSVRQVVGLAENEQNVMLQSANVQELAATGRELEGVDIRTQDEKADLTKAKFRTAGLEARVESHEAERGEAVMENTLETRLGDMVALLRTGDLSEAETTSLMDGMTAASSWSELQGVEVKIDEVSPSVNVYNKGTETITIVENGTKTQKLRLIKIASKGAAAPGELIEFTLRFENTGDEVIGNVTLVDNLSSRLAYVGNSAKASVKAEFLADTNEQGSLVLRWEITDPIKPGEFGVVQFMCKVR